MNNNPIPCPFCGKKLRTNCRGNYEHDTDNCILSGFEFSKNNLEKWNKRKTTDNERKYVYLRSTNDSDIEKAESKSLDVITAILEEAVSDDANESSRLIDFYKSLSETERAVADYVLVCLCGWTMHTIIKEFAKPEAE
ncbi:MAG: hypothetical protein IJO13_07115 [Lachnospiraceae bacterium]|nr:hypothetical protein [Lachnospiraceae bacterium]